MCCMLDSLQQVCVGILKYTHKLATGRLCLTQENPNRHPHAHNRCYKYHPQVLNMLTLCGYQVTFELYHTCIYVYTCKILTGHLTDSLVCERLFFTTITTITMHNIKITIMRATAITESAIELEDESSELSTDITRNHNHTLTMSGALQQ